MNEEKTYIMLMELVKEYNLPYDTIMGLFVKSEAHNMDMNNVEKIRNCFKSEMDKLNRSLIKAYYVIGGDIEITDRVNQLIEQLVMRLSLEKGISKIAAYDLLLKSGVHDEIVDIPKKVWMKECREIYNVNFVDDMKFKTK